MKRPSLGYSNYHWINSDKKRYKELDAISEQNAGQEIMLSTAEEEISQQITEQEIIVSTIEESQKTETNNIATVVPSPIVVHANHQETKSHLP